MQLIIICTLFAEKFAWPDMQNKIGLSDVWLTILHYQSILVWSQNTLQLQRMSMRKSLIPNSILSRLSLLTFHNLVKMKMLGKSVSSSSVGNRISVKFPESIILARIMQILSWFVRWHVRLGCQDMQYLQYMVFKNKQSKYFYLEQSLI